MVPLLRIPFPSDQSQTYYPVLDGDFLQQSATTQLTSGQFIRVPILIGTNTDEGTAFGPRKLNTTSQFLSFLQTYTTDNTSITTLAYLSPDIPAIGIPTTFDGRPGPDLGLQYKRSSAVAGDYAMHASRRLVNQIWAAHNVSSYSYRFNVLATGTPHSIGSTHFQEVAFVFDNREGLGYPQLGGPNPFQGRPGSYRELARLMSRMWVSFINSGDPNGSNGE
jgi:carboxylesterase type B